MTKYIDANLLIRKIRGLIRLENLNFAALGGGGQTFCINTLEWVLKQIDSLQQEQPEVDSEKPMNPDDAMKELDEKIALVKQRGTWDGVDVDKYMDEVRGREPGKPIPADLEEAANHHICKTVDAVKRRGWELETQDITDAFIAGAKWQKEQDEKEQADLFTIVALDAAQRAKEQMMKEAVDAIVEDWNPDPEPEITIPLNPEEFTRGDKVLVIVIPKTDKK